MRPSRFDRPWYAEEPRGRISVWPWPWRLPARLEPHLGHRAGRLLGCPDRVTLRRASSSGVHEPGHFAGAANRPGVVPRPFRVRGSRVLFALPAELLDRTADGFGHRVPDGPPGRYEELNPSATRLGKALGGHAPRRPPLFIEKNPSKEASNPRLLELARFESAPRAPSETTPGPLKPNFAGQIGATC